MHGIRYIVWIESNTTADEENNKCRKGNVKILYVAWRLICIENYVQTEVRKCVLPHFKHLNMNYAQTSVSHIFFINARRLTRKQR